MTPTQTKPPEVDASLSDLLGFVDEETLNLVEVEGERFTRGRLIQGDPKHIDNAKFKDSIICQGGIGLSVDGLPEHILEAPGVEIVTLENSGKYATFESMKIVVLAKAKIRRFYYEAEGKRQLVCGTNTDGVRGGTGWASGAQTCKECPHHSSNIQGDKKYACKASVAVLAYLPEFDHTAVFSFSGSSYIEAADMVQNISHLTSEFPKRAEVRAMNPNLKRVNSFFFHTTISPSVKWLEGNDNKYKQIAYKKYEAPYNWAEITNSKEVLTKAKAALDASLEHWNSIYVDVPTVTSELLLTGTTSASAEVAAPQVVNVVIDGEVVPAAAETEPAPAVATATPQASAAADPTMDL